MWELIRSAGRSALDLVLPPRCPACRAIVSAPDQFCATCWPQLDFIAGPQCACCGLPFEVPQPEGTLCGGCMADPPPYDSARAAFVYAGTARQLVLALKHADRPHLARAALPGLRRAGAAMLALDAPLLVPVPLNRWRMWQRGYNQAALLAAILAKDTGTASDLDVLTRPRATKASRGMNRRQRARNVAGAFAIDNPARIKGRRVILVDDVLTTGATAGACARLLKKAGATSVHVLTLARVVLNPTQPHMDA